VLVLLHKQKRDLAQAPEPSFRFLSEYPPAEYVDRIETALELPEERGVKYWSAIHPEYIIKLTREVTPKGISGMVVFRANGLYKGAVDYVATPAKWGLARRAVPDTRRAIGYVSDA
jgi:hypothetical protein